MGTPNNPGPFDAMRKAEPDEPVFTLLGRDPLAGKLIREWATARHAQGEAGEVVMEALGVAAAMDAFQLAYSKRVVPPVIDTTNEE